MRRTLKLGALATAGYCLDGASAFHVPLSVQSRPLSSVSRSTRVSTGLAASESSDRGLRPRVATTRMATAGSPVGTPDPKVVGASVGATAAGGNSDGKDDEPTDSSESPEVEDGNVQAGPGAVGDEVAASSKSEDPFIEAEKEFKEAQERSIAANTTAEVANEVTPAPEADRTEEAAAIPKKPEMEVVKAEVKGTEKPKGPKEPEASKQDSLGGFFNFGAESLEEFFGITSKPRVVASSKPVPNEPDASGLPNLDASAVDSMVKEKGLNEVTLKEDFRAMEAEAKATQSAEEESEESVTTAVSKTKRAVDPNPFVAIVDLFTPEADDPTPATPSATKGAEEPETAVEAPALSRDVAKDKKKEAPSGLAAMFEGVFDSPASGKEKVTPPKPDSIPAKAAAVKSEEPVATPATEVKAEAKGTPNPFASLVAMFSPEPSASAPAAGAEAASEAERPKATSRPPAFSAKKAEPAVVPKAEVKAEKDEEASAGTGGFFGGMFAAPVYDDETDTLPKKVDSPRAMPVFAPPPAPTTAGSKKAPTAPKKVASPAPSFLDSLFGSTRPAEKVSATASKPLPSPPSKTEPSTPARTPVVSGTPGPSSQSKEADSKPAFDLLGLFGVATGEKKPPTPREVSAISSSPPRKAPAASQKKVTAVVKPPAPAPAPSPSLLDFFGGSKSKGSIPVAEEPEPQPEKKSSLFAGFLGGGGSGGSTGAKTATKPKPKRPLAPKPASPPPAPVVSRVKTMDDAFLRKVSVMLRRNQAKIKKFQQLTDRFRGGLIKAVTYYEGVEELFGEENVEEIIGPLLAALPENDKRKALQTVYNKAQKTKGNATKGEGAASSGGGLNFFGWGTKPPSASAPASAPTPTRKRSSTSAGSGAGGEPYAFAAAKLSVANFQLFKSRTQLYARGGINARNYYDTLVKVFGKSGVASQFPAVLKSLPSNKRKLLQDVYDGLNK